MNQDLDYNSDFYSFKEQIVNKFGEIYFEQAEIFFERAIAMAKNGFLYNAISDGQFALELTNYANDNKGVTSIIGFISQLYFDLGKIKKAYAYYELGIGLLDKESEFYEEDIELFRRLKELIDSENWKDDLSD